MHSAPANPPSPVGQPSKLADQSLVSLIGPQPASRTARFTMGTDDLCKGRVPIALELNKC